MVQSNFYLNILNKTSWPNRILRVIIGILFIYVGYARLRHPNLIAEHMMQLNLIPWSLLNFFAMWMLVFEIFIGILVISGIWLRAASIIIIGFCTLCIFLISYALINNLSMNCGCFITAATGSPRNWSSLYQEGIILIGGILLLMTNRDKDKKTGIQDQ